MRVLRLLAATACAAGLTFGLAPTANAGIIKPVPTERCYPGRACFYYNSGWQGALAPLTTVAWWEIDFVFAQAQEMVLESQLRTLQPLRIIEMKAEPTASTTTADGKAHGSTFQHKVDSSWRRPRITMLQRTGSPGIKMAEGIKIHCSFNSNSNSPRPITANRKTEL